MAENNHVVEQTSETCEPPPEKKAKVTEVEAALASRTGFSSEIYKIELRGLPRFFSLGTLKKIMKNKGLDYHKLKPTGKNASYMFVNFRNGEDRDRALKELDGIEIKGKKIQTLLAKPPKDPMVRAMEEKTDEKPEEVDTRTVSERLRDAICPLGNTPYEEQLQDKQKVVEDLLKKVRHQVTDEFKSAHVSASVFESDPILEVRPFVASPSTQGYRGKCEFTVGKHPESGEVTVGFRLASYRRGSVAVAGAEDLPVVSDKMKTMCSRFERYVRSSGLDPFDTVSQSGNWRQLTVREATSGVMVWALCHPQGLDQEAKDKIRTEYKAAMEEEKDVVSVHIQFMGNRTKGVPDAPIELLSGEPYIAQRLCGLDFRISPQAFFQINCGAAETLYRLCGELANIDSDTTVLDVCCGTGTIGLCLANQCKEVIGVDIVEEAVKDANLNAERNGVKNATFEAGRAEVLLGSQLRRAKGSKVVAVVDPPRAGLHPKALQAIRSSKVTTLVYISCDAKAASGNFATLARPTSNSHPGDPFVPRLAVPVDMFPHTRHFELAILFERVSMIGLLEKRFQKVTDEEKKDEAQEEEKC